MMKIVFSIIILNGCMRQKKLVVLKLFLLQNNILLIGTILKNIELVHLFGKKFCCKKINKFNLQF